MIDSYSISLTHQASLMKWVENISALFNANSLSHQPLQDQQWPLETSQPPKSGSIDTEVHFDNKKDCEQMSRFLSSQSLEHKTKFDKVAPWQQYHQKFMKPITIGKLTVEPTNPPETLKANTLYFPAGVGFGTGHHETTQGCLQLMQTLNFKDKAVLDFGSGSGILSVASSMLGASTVYYLDIDPQAVEATNNNFNAHKQLTTAHQFDLSNPPQTLDCIFANILFEPLLDNRKTFSNLLNHKGLLITSGVISSQHTDFVDAFSENFEPVEHHQLDQWCSYLWKKK